MSDTAASDAVRRVLALCALREQHNVRDDYGFIVVRVDDVRAMIGEVLTPESRLEKVARALCAASDWDEFTEQWDTNRQYWLDLAREAIHVVES